MTDRSRRKKPKAAKSGDPKRPPRKPDQNRPAGSGAAHTPDGLLSESAKPARNENVSEAAKPARNAISPEAARFARNVEPLDAPGDISKTALPELLLPAGSPLALEAAIEAGADAVYFGARSFSARARAVNFGDGDISAALRLCRAYGVKAYAAVNTRLRDSELSEAMRLVDLLAAKGADALIVADLGLCAVIRREYGDAIELHASTQLTPVSSYDARALAELGFSRMVAPRELTLGQLSALCENSPIEIEAFIHGAHCVSLSGQCLMSSLIGGRSANRGECAQPCRMGYGCGKESGALLSLCDMCYAPDVPALISTGVRSLKVEGRQKDAAYVFGVGRVYRRLLDECRAASPDEIEELALLFERGFTDGYLRGDLSDMRGVRREDAPTNDVFPGLSRRVPASAVLTLRAGEAPALEMTAGALAASVSLGDPAPEAGVEALSRERAEKQIARLGGTPFELTSFEFITDGVSWLPASSLNELRRRAVDALLSPAPQAKDRPLSGAARAVPRTAFGAGTEATASPENDRSPKESVFPRLSAIPAQSCVLRPAQNAPRRTAEFVCAAQIPPAAFGYFDAIYLPWSEFDGEARRRGVRLSLPPFMTDETAEAIAPLISPGDRVLAHSVGRSLGAIPDASLRLNVWNAECANVIASLCGGGTLTVSPELTRAAMRDISRSVGGALAAAYGKLPVMFTVRCMLRGCVKCKGGAGGASKVLRESEPCRAYLTDRTGAKFFVFGGRDCSNSISNSVPTWTADRPIPDCGEHFVFSDDSADEAASVIAAYERREAPPAKARRVK